VEPEADKGTVKQHELTAASAYKIFTETSLSKSKGQRRNDIFLPSGQAPTNLQCTRCYSESMIVNCKIIKTGRDLKRSLVQPAESRVTLGGQTSLLGVLSMSVLKSFEDKSLHNIPGQPVAPA